MSKERKGKRKSRASGGTTESATKKEAGVLHKEKCAGR